MPCRAGTGTLTGERLAVASLESALGAAEDAEINGLVALSQSVATRLSQTALYKRAFGKVLVALSDESRHEADMVKMMAMTSGPD